MKILITSPMGSIGRRILPELLAPEFSVRVISRNPNRLPREIREQVEIVHGSATEHKTLRRALQDVEALFWCVPRGSFPEASVPAKYERFAQAASAAICEAATPRVVAFSTIDRGWVPNADHVSVQHTVEGILNECGAAIRHVRCGWLMENFLQQTTSILRDGLILYPVPGDIPIPLVAAADVADVVLRRLVRRDWSGIESIAIQGPQDLSFDQAAAVLERILNRRVRYRGFSADEYIRNLTLWGANADYGPSVIDLLSEFAHGHTRAEAKTTRTRTPTTLAAWTRSEVLPLLQSLNPQPVTVTVVRKSPAPADNWRALKFSELC